MVRELNDVQKDWNVRINDQHKRDTARKKQERGVSRAKKARKS